MSYRDNEGKTLKIQKLTRKYGLKIIEDKDSLRIENDFNWSNSGLFISILGLGIVVILVALYHCLTVEAPYPIESMGKVLLLFILLIPIYFAMVEMNYFVSIDISKIKIYKPTGIKVIPYNREDKIEIRKNTSTQSGKYSSETYLDVKVILKRQKTEITLFQFSDLELEAHEIVQLAKQLVGLMRKKMLSFNGNTQTK